MSEVKMNITKQELARDIRLTPSGMEQAKAFWVARIQRVTRSGKSIADGSKFAKLKDSYVNYRKRWKGPTSEHFKPSKSNLTFSGEMLESLKGRSNVRTQTITVFPSGKRNKDLAKWNAEQRTFKNGYTKPARVFLGLDDKGRERIVQIAKRDLRRSLKRKRQKPKR